MNPYPKVLNDLGFASWVQRLPVDGHPAISNAFHELNNERAFPPCFIPLLERSGTGPHYLGVLKHWFVDRRPVFVECSVENNHMLWEFARNQNQFAARLLVSAIEFGQDEPSDQFRGLSHDLAFTDADELFQLYRDFEDGAFERLAYFVEDPPAALSFMNGFVYKGEFQLEQLPFDENRSQHCSRVELDNETIRQSWPDVEPAAWQQPGDQSMRFNAAFGDQRFADCWLIANSNGWNWGDLRDAIGRLVSVSDDRLFHDTMAAWQKSPHECWGETF